MSMPGAIGEAIGGGGFIYITIDGRRVRQKIATWGRKIDDLSPVWDAVGFDLRKLWEDNFLSEGRMLARRYGWEELAPATVYDRERKGYDGEHPILLREGDLMQSATTLYGAGNISRVTKLGAEFGTNWYTAAWLNYGTRYIPSRTIVGVSRDMRSNILKRLNDYTHQLAVEYWNAS